MECTIWTCWFQGVDQQPAIVRKCIASWKRVHGAQRVVVIDDQHPIARELETFLKTQIPDFFQRVHITTEYTGYSNILRLYVLSKYGGIWVDATVMCTRHVDEYIPIGEKFFIHRKCATGLENFIATWFIVARHPHHYVIDTWLDRVIEYWRVHDTNPGYFWVQPLYRDLCESDAIFSRHHAECATVTDELPCTLMTLGYETLYNARMHRQALVRAVRHSPMMKLTYKTQLKPENRAFVRTVIGAYMSSLQQFDHSKFDK